MDECSICQPICMPLTYNATGNILFLAIAICLSFLAVVFSISAAVWITIELLICWNSRKSHYRNPPVARDGRSPP